MKICKYFKSAMLVLCLAIGITACNDNNSMNVEPEPEMYTINLGWDGEIINVMYEPLTRTTTSDLYGIQVYSTPNNTLSENETATWTPYAFGLFDNPDIISINLIKGYKYWFVATMVKEGKDKINSSNKESFSAPFAHYATEGYMSYTQLNNTFNYGTIGYINGGITSQLSSSYTHLIDRQLYNHPNTDRFYGELINFIPSETNTSANIHMKRVAFGAKFIAQGQYATQGTLDIHINNAPEMSLELTDGDNIISDIFTFSDLAAAWSNNAYIEEISVTLTWTRPDGSTLPLGTHNINYQRNTTTVVTVNIENISHSNSLGFIYDETYTDVIPEDNSLDVTITDGEIVDTDIDSN